MKTGRRIFLKEKQMIFAEISRTQMNGCLLLIPIRNYYKKLTGLSFMEGLVFV